MNCGVYQIVNLINYRRYIGASTNISLRWYRHKNELNKNIHHNINLQNDWNRYSENNFLFDVISHTTSEYLSSLEEFYINQYRDIMYNIGLPNYDNITLNPNRDKIIAKISESMHDRYISMSEVEKESLSHSLLGDKNPNWKGGISGKNLCPVCKMNMKKHNSNMCYECSLKNKYGKNNSFYGKTHTKETIQKISESNRGRISPIAIRVRIGDKIYSSATEAARSEGCVCATIFNRIKSEAFPNYNFVEDL